MKPRHIVSVALSADLFTALKAEAERTRASRAQVMRSALAKHIAAPSLAADDPVLPDRLLAVADDMAADATSEGHAQMAGRGLKRAEQMAIGGYLRAAGWHRRRIMVKGCRRWRWVPPHVDEPPNALTPEQEAKLSAAVVKEVGRG